jgi:cation transport protein ChaC
MMSPADPAMAEVAFFGYGSLVNELTLPRGHSIEPARIRHWIREWRHCVKADFGRVCALTVSRQENEHIEGVFLRCRKHELRYFDEREIGYRRVPLTRSDVLSSKSNLPEELYIYTSNPKFYRTGDLQYPIWLSYAEVVIYGYLKVFGEIGADRFIQSTKGWTTPVLDDRRQPRYPRVTELSEETRALIEAKLIGIKGIKIYNA